MQILRVCQHTVASISLTYWVSFISGVYSFHLSLRFSYIPSLSPFPPGEEPGLVPSYESHVSGEQRGRQRAEWDAVSAGETGEHCQSGGSALRPAGWAQRTGRMLLQPIFHALVEKVSSEHCAICNCLIAQSKTASCSVADCHACAVKSTSHDS